MHTLKRLLRKVPCLVGLHTWKLVYVDGRLHTEHAVEEPIRIACICCGKAP